MTPRKRDGAEPQYLPWNGPKSERKFVTDTNDNQHVIQQQGAYRPRPTFDAAIEKREAIYLTLPLPPMGNDYRGISWAQRRFYLRPPAIQYRKDVAIACVVAGIRTPLTCEVDVGIAIFRARRSGDTDGFLKVLLDSMEDAVYVNDRQIRDILYVRKREDKKAPRVEVEVREVAA